jgi:LacI family transcriptional regulator
MGAKYLVEAGLRHFAFCGFANCHWSKVRETTFREIINDAGFDCSVHSITSAIWMKRPNWMENWEHEKPVLAKWLKSLPKPVGVMACNDTCGTELLQVCTTHRLRVPDEVAVVGVDNDEMLCELSDPPLSSVALDVEKAGYEAAQLLDRLMGGLAGAGQMVLVEPTHVAARRSSDVIAQEDPLVARAMRFMREHARNALSVSDVAEDIGVSRRTLERRFIRAVRRTVLEEIMRSHLTRAKQLLLETDLPCYQIATQSGFGSLKTFHRCFSRWEQTTPLSFRLRSAAGIHRPAGAASALRSPGSNLNSHAVRPGNEIMPISV